MKINRELVDKVAKLARLEIKDDQASKLMQEMNEIISWVEKLEDVDTDGVEPLRGMSMEVNKFRKDEVRNELPHDQALVNAPKKDKDFFKVPKVIE